MNRFIFFLFFVLSSARLLAADECLPVNDVTVNYEFLGVEKAKRFVFLKGKEDPDFVEAYRSAVDKEIGLENIVSAYRRSRMQCGINVERIKSRSFAANERDISVSVCYYEPSLKQIICIGSEDDWGIPSGDGSPGSGTGAGGTEGGSGGLDNIFNPWGCTTSTSGGTSISVCADGSEGIYVPGRGVVVVFPGVEDARQGIEEASGYFKDFSSNMNNLIREGYSDLSSDERKVLAVNKADFERIVAVVKSRIQNGTPSPDVAAIVRNTGAKFKESQLSEKTIKAFEREVDILDKAGISARGLSPRQVTAFVKKFVERSHRMDQDLAQGKKSKHIEDVNEVINEASQLTPFSPSFAVDKAAYEGLLGRYTNDGIVKYPLGTEGRRYDFKTDIFSRDADERYVAATLRTMHNKDLERRFSGAEGASNALLVNFVDEAFSSGDIDLSYRYLDMLYSFEDFADGLGGQYSGSRLTPEGRAYAGRFLDPNDFFKQQVIELANELSEYGSDLSSEVELASKLALRGALNSSSSGNFNLALYNLISAAQFAEFMAGNTVSFVKTGYQLISGKWEFEFNPIDSLKHLSSLIYNHEEIFSSIAESITREADAVVGMSNYEKGIFAGKVAANVVDIFASQGYLSIAPPAISNITKASKASVLKGLDDVVKGVNGYRKIRANAPNLLDTNKLYNKYNLTLTRKAADLDGQFISDLGSYARRSDLSQADTLAIMDYSEGFSYFVPKQTFERFHGGKPNSFEKLGAPDGLFVTTKQAASELFEGGLDASTYRKVLGFPDDHLQWQKGEEILKIDLPMDFSYNPRLPKSDNSRANDLFIEGGFTSGGAPELILIQPPVADIERKISIGKLK